jgi:hypothetical protein
MTNCPNGIGRFAFVICDFSFHGRGDHVLVHLGGLMPIPDLHKKVAVIALQAASGHGFARHNDL